MRTISILALSVAIFAATSISAKKTTSGTSTTAAPAASLVTKYYETYKTCYKLDTQGRVVNKVIYKEEHGVWNPVGAYSVFYGDKENILTYAKWDSRNKAFTLSPEQKTFNSIEYPIILPVPGN